MTQIKQLSFTNLSNEKAYEVYSTHIQKLNTLLAHQFSLLAKSVE